MLGRRIPIKNHSLKFCVDNVQKKQLKLLFYIMFKENILLSYDRMIFINIKLMYNAKLNNVIVTKTIKIVIQTKHYELCETL